MKQILMLQQHSQLQVLTLYKERCAICPTYFPTTRYDATRILFKKVKEIAKHDAEYELYQQRNELEKDHRTKYEAVQAQVIKLQEENEVFRSRENDFDIARVKEELRVSEETLKKAESNKNNH